MYSSITYSSCDDGNNFWQSKGESFSPVLFSCPNRNHSQDILRVWMFWRKHPQALATTSEREAELTSVNNGQAEPEDDNKVRSISSHSIRHEFVVAVPT